MKGVAVGKYTISNNMVSIEYTDESFRIKDENRHGSLTMKSYINNDENGGQTDINITYKFPDIDDITFHLIPKESPSKLEIVKGIFRLSPSDVPTSLRLDDVDKTHVYRTKKDTSAKTGDSFMGVIAMIFMLIAMIYIVAFGVYKRRKNRDDK